MQENNPTTTLSSVILLILKELRLERNMHQAQVAEACDKTPSAWTKIELGKSPLSMDFFLEYVIYYKVHHLLSWQQQKDILHY